MISTAKNSIINLNRKWHFLLWLETALFGLGPAVLLYLVTGVLWWSVVAFMAISGITSLVLRPWKMNLGKICSYIDAQCKAMEYSTGLLLVPAEALPDLARLQQQKIANQLEEVRSGLKPLGHLRRAILITLFFFSCGLILSQFGLLETLRIPRDKSGIKDTIIFKSADSTSRETVPPKLTQQLLRLQFPAYTRARPVSTRKMDVKAVMGTNLSWEIGFNDTVESVAMESISESFPMRWVKGRYIHSSVVEASGFYNFRFTDTLGGSYVSELYTLEAVEDQGPVLEVRGLKQFSSFRFSESKDLNFNTLVTDDYGIAAVAIIATVSKGSGESVKFREEKLPFDDEVVAGERKLELSKRINLDDLAMEPGDELYFYIEATDTKKPGPNTTRGETFFAVIRDTVSNTFAVEGTMGADLMPDYFRSQRQLIIDTEKLIKDKPVLSKQEFNSLSNELGYDQKSLRIKYGEFMGDEAVGEMTVTADPEEAEDTVNDILESYTHDHDGDNEHNLVDHQEEAEDESNSNPLSTYVHNHEDPEASTLFAQSLKSKLMQAMGEMWDAELYLRLYEPDKSLPYQYKALELLQEIKNSARIYVHRIGFDPPPIKEDKRLTGEMKDIANFRKREAIATPEEFPNMRDAVVRLEQLIREGTKPTKADRSIFEQAGNELARKAIEEPGAYLETLQHLKWLTEEMEIPPGRFSAVQRGLLSAIPKASPGPDRDSRFLDTADKMLLEELEKHDR